jgi:hypothetical protein
MIARFSGMAASGVLLTIRKKFYYLLLRLVVKRQGTMPHGKFYAGISKVGIVGFQF